jgi:hypothetical protein
MADGNRFCTHLSAKIRRNVYAEKKTGGFEFTG